MANEEMEIVATLKVGEGIVRFTFNFSELSVMELETYEKTGVLPVAFLQEFYKHAGLPSFIKVQVLQAYFHALEEKMK